MDAYIELAEKNTKQYLLRDFKTLQLKKYIEIKRHTGHTLESTWN